MAEKIDHQSATGSIEYFTKAYNGTENTVVFASKQAWDDSRNGSDNPRWRYEIAHGLNATTNYICSFKTFTPVNVKAVATVTKPNGQQQKAEMNGHPTAFWSIVCPDPLSAALTQADIAAREKFISHYRERRTQFQSGVFLGELAKTVQMIRNPASALRRGIDRYYATVKKRLRRSKHPQRTIRDTWLEYVMGWGPLINDVEDAVGLATADPYAVSQYLSGKGKVDQLKTRQSGSFSNGICKVDFTSEQTLFGEVKYKGAIRAQNHPPGFPEQLGLSWSNVLPTVWELIPYSFLVDYFTNVGKVIDGISTGTIWLSWGCRVDTRKGEVEILDSHLDKVFLDAQAAAVSGRASGNATGAGPVSSRTMINRVVITNVSLGIGDVRFKIPAKWKQWLNIGALAKLRH